MDALLHELVSEDINGVVAGYTTSSATQYLGAHGTKNSQTREPLTLDTRIALFSCTKSMTAMAALKLWEDGRLDLDRPAKEYLPTLGDIGVMENFDMETGEYTLRRPKTDITVRHLLLSNSGFAYPFTDPRYAVLGKKTGANSFSMPLVSDPGSRWIYGHSMDWAGLVIEAVAGMKLSQFLEQQIFSKAGMTSCTFQVEDQNKLMPVHIRRDSGLKVMRRQPLEHKPKTDMGGQGCFATVADYLRFLRVWLNYGTSPDTGHRILKRETVEYAIQNHLPPGQHMEFAAGGEGFKPDGFTMAGCAYSNNQLPTGRPEGSLYWGGLANLFIWLDFENDVAGIFACQILPYMDPKCLVGYLRFEHEVYEAVKQEENKDRPSPNGKGIVKSKI
ncbi:Beta-lactamase family protein [Clavispora lusitaniae]|uniref:Beta-lactamase family protein n=1 Tax=Clavispora lusitaniae TaxID=36911 RepID=UPI00202C36D5|nr:Beta-lactamase family protein [Clavispora lusitaniae]